MVPKAAAVPGTARDAVDQRSEHICRLRQDIIGNAKIAYGKLPYDDKDHNAHNAKHRFVIATFVNGVTGQRSGAPVLPGGTSKRAARAAA